VQRAAGVHTFASEALVRPYTLRAAIPLPSNVVHVPVVKQRTDFSCGTAAALSLLRLWRHAEYATVDEARLYVPLQTTERDGTEPEPIIAYLRGVARLDADYSHGDVTLAQLERALDAGAPPMVDLQCWRDDGKPWSDVWDAGHYAIFVGYDAEHLFFMDPSVLTPGAYAFIPRAELAERWHDLSGPANSRLYNMALFVRGDARTWRPDADAPSVATRMG
jgi:predicted double-glycine peptidase